MTINIGFGAYRFRKKKLKTLIAETEKVTGERVDTVSRFFMYLGRGFWYFFLPVTYPLMCLDKFLKGYARTPEEGERHRQKAHNTLLLKMALKKVYREDYPDDKTFCNAVVLKAIERPCKRFCGNFKI